MLKRNTKRQREKMCSRWAYENFKRRRKRKTKDNLAVSQAQEEKIKVIAAIRHRHQLTQRDIEKDSVEKSK